MSKYAIRDRSLIADQIAYPFAFLKFHEAAGTAIADVAGTLATATMQGTTAGIWANPHLGVTWSGDGYVLFNDAAAQSLINLAAGNQRLLVALWMRWANAPAPAAEDIISAGATNNTNEALGAWGVRLGTNGRPNFMHRFKGPSAAVDISLQPGATPSTGALHHVAFDIDLTGTPGGTIFIDGAENATVANFSGPVGQGLATPDRLYVGCRWDSSTGPTQFANGATTPSGLIINSLLIARPPVTMVGDIPTIISDLAKSRGGDLVESLIG